MAQILVVDDEIGIRELLSEILADEGHDVKLAENAAQARAARAAARPDLVLLDIWMPDTDGITLLKEWAASGQLTMPVIMMSGHGTIETAVEATRVGALEFLEKPIGMQKLLSTVRHALEHAPRPGVGTLSLAAFPRSAPLKELKKRIEQMAHKSRSLLLKGGENSVAELAAHSLLAHGRPWFDLAHDSQPLSLDILQSLAGGVLWCEELSRLSRLQQKNLLFALDRLDKYDLHLVIGSSYDMAHLAAAGWDEGALRRLFEVWLPLPTLADLRDEVPDIASHLLTQMADTGEIPLRRLSTAAQNALRQYHWPGGYGELKSIIKSLALAATEEEIDDADVARLLHPQNGGRVTPLPSEILDLPLREAREAFERIYFDHHMKLESGNMTRLAEKTGLERTHLYRKLKDLGLRGGAQTNSAPHET